MRKTNFNEHDAEICQYLADGYTVSEIAKVMGVKVRTLQSQVERAKDKSLSKTLSQMVANYMRKQLIK